MTLKPLRVVIRITVPPACTDLPRIFESTERFTKALLGDVGLSEVELDVALGDENLLSDEPWRIRIDGQVVRSDRTHWLSPPATAIQWDLLRNRSLLISMGLVNHLTAKWWGVQWPVEKALRLQGLLKESMERGLDVSMVHNLFPDPPDQMEIERAYSTIFRDQRLALRVALEPKAWHSADRRIEDLKAEVQMPFFEACGVFIPGLELRDDPELSPSGIQIQVNDLRLPVTEMSSCIVDTVLNQVGEFLNCFITFDTVERSLDILEQSAPRLTELFRKTHGTETLWRILSWLIEEMIPLLDLRAILSGIASLEGDYDGDLVPLIVFPPYTGRYLPRVLGEVDRDFELLEVARTSLSGRISSLFSVPAAAARASAADHAENGSMGSPRPFGTPDPWTIDVSRTMQVHLVELSLEEQVALSATAPMDTADLVREVHYWQKQNQRDGPFIILVSVEARRRLWELLRFEFPGLAVLSYQELSANLNIEPVARISF
jgi:hypothetical protein